MHNYDHEIARPEDRAMRKFLWCDYFRDSEILSVQLEKDKRSRVVITLKSDRDQRAVWRRFNDDFDKWNDYVEEHAEKFVYMLKFTCAEYFERRQTGGWTSEFVNARFKDSALLRRLQKKTGRRLYHLRIHTSDGLIDLVFGGFEIRRISGRVNYSMNEIADPAELNDFEKEMAAEEKYTSLPKDDDERCRLLRRMYAVGHPSLLRALRDGLNAKETCGDAKSYAAYLLGKIGDAADIPGMMDVYLELENELLEHGYDYHCILQRKQNVIDAIELIRYRMEV